MSRLNTKSNRSARAPIAIAAVAAAAVAFAAPALAQSNVDSVNKFSWSENCGWMNWRDAGIPTGTQGALFSGSFASGFVWMENLGWLNLGDGTPTNGTNYSNPTSGFVVGTPDFGVNINTATGNLSGFAWSENAGWINFSGGALATPPQPARLDTAAGRLRGYAWGENIGWINLDVAEAGKFVGVDLTPPCRTDFNGDGIVSPDDLDEFITTYFSEAPDNASADFNNDGIVSPDDLDEFITAYFEGC